MTKQEIEQELRIIMQERAILDTREQMFLKELEEKDGNHGNSNSN